MWSMNTNKYLGGLVVVAWLLLVADFVGDQLIPPMKPIVSEVAAGLSSAPETSATKPAEPELPLGVLLASFQSVALPNPDVVGLDKPTNT